MTAKQHVIEMLAQLPDDCTMEDIEYHVHVLRKVQLSEEASARGEVLSLEDAKRRFSEWRKK